VRKAFMRTDYTEREEGGGRREQNSMSGGGKRLCGIRAIELCTVSLI
jgi:hypothetical protein